MQESRVPGLRLQIVLALGGLMMLAFVPLSFAVARIADATLLAARSASARAVARAVALHIVDAEHAGRDLAPVLATHVAHDGIDAAAIFDAHGQRRFGTGDTVKLSAMRAMHGQRDESSIYQNHAIEVGVPIESGSIVIRFAPGEGAERAAQLVKLIALYTTVFAIALLLLAYFALTRLIVRPLEALVRAADRVAGGARQLQVPRAGAREIAELGQSVHAMTVALFEDEQALRGKVEELETTQGHLVRSERLASVGRLAAGIGHEIGNPLAALLGMEDLLLQGDLSPSQSKDFLLRMKKETERIHSVLRDLLDFARPERAPSSTMIAAAAHVQEIVHDVLALVRHQKGFRDVTIAEDLGPEPLTVTLSGPRLTQVLLNLVMNAGDALAERKGHVTVRAREVQGRRVRLEVEDDGPGIPPEVRAHMFEPFVTTKPVGSGTGLGLAVCRGIVESVGGRIGVDIVDRGARLFIELPGGRRA